MALICFSLVLQILSLVSIYIAHSGQLILCARQSNFDLSCLSYVREIIDHNSRIRICGFDETDLILETSINIDEIQVLFKDHETFLDCTYTKENKKIHMRIYYDTQGIQDLEYL